ncbi:chromate efflux transporter [Vibrio sp. AK197]
MLSIFKIFFALGWVSFGGPAAHIGYFRRTFVEQKQWLSDDEYAQLVALSQFLPGPGSSQVGFAIGYHKAGLSGAISAFLGFTLPSVLLMLLLAIISHQFIDTPLFDCIIHGLKLLAVVVVADAIWGMYRSFCTTTTKVTLCITTAVAILIFPSMLTQMVLLAATALIGFLTRDKHHAKPHQRFTPNYWPLILFIGLLIVPPLFTSTSSTIPIFNAFFQAGSLVFGGGHVVVPLLQNIVGDQLQSDMFITGYAAAQAVPGPMFSLATFLGYQLSNEAPLLGAVVATVAVFLPGFLLLLVVLKKWSTLSEYPAVAGALSGVNAAVVGLLIAALYQPIFSSSVLSPIDMALILIGWFLLKVLKLPILALVAFFVISGVVQYLVI